MVIDYQSVVNQQLQSLKPSGIRKFFDITSEMDDVVSLSTSEPGFSAPWRVRQAGIQTLEEGKTWYSSNRGFMEPHQEIYKWVIHKCQVEYDPATDVAVTVDSSEAISASLRSLVSPGDEVFTPEPSFVCYMPFAQVVGGVPVILETKVENDFRLTAEELHTKVTPKTEVLVLPFPSDPTGAVMRHEYLEEITAVVKEHNLIVISDEIYSGLAYGDTPRVNFAVINDTKKRTILISGFSKAYAMTGWRLGFAIGPTAIITQMTKLRQYSIMSALTISQYVATEALKDGDDDIEKMRSQYGMRRQLIVDGFNSLNLTYFEPEGAFYVFPYIENSGLSSEEFCERLIYAKEVAIIPGNAFGDYGKGFARVAYSNSVPNIAEILKRIERFLGTLK